jgi:hypothetical protein
MKYITGHNKVCSQCWKHCQQQLQIVEAAFLQNTFRKSRHPFVMHISGIFQTHFAFSTDLFSMLSCIIVNHGP